MCSKIESIFLSQDIISFSWKPKKKIVLPFKYSPLVCLGNSAISNKKQVQEKISKN